MCPPLVTRSLSQAYLAKLPGSSDAGPGRYKTMRAIVRRAVGSLASQGLAKVSREVGEGQRWTLLAMGWGCPE